MKKVFLDFGHGGTDSGAIGNGLKEKDIVLQIGTKVKKLLEINNIKVHTSRDNDKTVSLQERCNLANKSGSDCFISLHCNSYSNLNSKGLEVYSSTSKTEDLATRIYNQLVQDKLYTSKRGLKHELFYVLRNTKMRAALIELAFISNTADANLLRNKQDEFSESIAKGICNYLNLNYVGYNKKYKNCILYANDIDKVAAEIISWSKDDCILKNVKNHVAWESDNLLLVGGGAKTELDKMNTKEKYTSIIGSDRYETIRKCLEFIGK